MQEKTIKSLKKEFETPLGVMRCGLNSDNFGLLLEKKQYTNGTGEVFLTDAHKVEMITFKLKMPLYNGGTVKDSCGWIFRIEKIAEMYESLETYCLLDKIDEKVWYSPNHGQYLDSISAENEDWVLNIGTEDGESLDYRAEKNIWFPSRFKGTFDMYRSITKVKENGFTTKIPDLHKNEKIYIHYLVALDKNREGNNNTWLAVQDFKTSLENWIGL